MSASLASLELFPPLHRPSDREALRFGDDVISFSELAAASGGLASALEGARRVAVLATPTLETVVGVVGALAAGAAVVPVNPSATAREIEHILGDSTPDVLVATGDELPGPLGALPRVSPRGPAAAYSDAGADDPERTALVLYTSGTTGLPKGAEIPRRAIMTNLDALARAWQCTSDDRLAHALPLFHIHGLVLGTLGPLRLGAHLRHLGRFAPESIAQAVADGASMVFGVPTMYHRIADACESSPSVGDALSRARLLVSGSAALPAYEHHRIERLTGQKIVERYGMTETVMNTAVRADEERRPSYVGRPVDGVELRLVDDDGNALDVADDETIGEILVRGPNLFTGYLNRPEATAEAIYGGWFHTGDMATRSADGYIRIVGRRSTDLIKSGGFKIGAGEIEGALLEHPAVAEVAVTGEADEDLGERVVAWVVLRPEEKTSADELISHASGLLSSHKRPRSIHFVEALPRNAMGKVVKKQLTPPAPS